MYNATCRFNRDSLSALRPGRWDQLIKCTWAAAPRPLPLLSQFQRVLKDTPIPLNVPHLCASICSHRFPMYDELDKVKGNRQHGRHGWHGHARQTHPPTPAHGRPSACGAAR